jgi:uncharacterized YccA/Bax inhibitor family protein
MRSGNPVLRDSTFSDAKPGSGVMTLDGVINKTGILILICMVGFLTAWYQSVPSMPLGVAGALIGFVLGLTTCFVPKISPYTSPVYAFCEGLFLGTVSAILEARFPYIAAQAAALTFGTLVVMLTLYKTRIIRVTEGLKTAVIAATAAIALLYVVCFVLSMFGKQVPYIHSSGPIGIAFSLFVVGLAAFNLLLDFDFIEQGVYAGAPKYLEWYAGFSLLVTLVWLYLELLRLLSKLRGRN